MVAVVALGLRELPRTTERWTPVTPVKVFFSALSNNSTTQPLPNYDRPHATCRITAKVSGGVGALTDAFFVDKGL